MWLMLFLCMLLHNYVLILFLPFFRCCAHILNLLVQDGISEIGDIIESVRDSVKYLTASITRMQQFAEIAKMRHLSGKKLVLDCTTRWNATYLMLSTALEFREVIYNIQVQFSVKYLVF